MTPIVMGLGAIALGWLGYEKLLKPKTAYQVQPVTGTGGIPLRILTPISEHVTGSQATGVPTPPSPKPATHLVASRPAPAIAQVVPGQGTVYAPPKMVDVTSSGAVQLAPIIISPTGASSVAIGSVKDVQAALNTLGYAPKLNEDNQFGPKTVTNIRAFQSKVGLVVDGNASPAVKAALSDALAAFVAGGPTASVAAAATATVASGKAIAINTAKDVQHGLNLLGASPSLQEDGKPGPKTIAAIKSFQLTHGLTVDGVAGPKTKAAISIAISAPVAVSGQFNGQFSGSFG